VAGVLGAALAGPAALARAQGRDGDLALLRYLLRVQELESALYREALQRVPDLAPGQRALVERLRDDEVQHVDAVRATLRDAGGVPDPRAVPAFGAALGSAAAFLKLANTLEDTGVSALNGAVPLLASPDLRAAVVSVAQVEARHAALVRVARDRPPAPAPFDRASTSQAVRSRIRRFERR
jgi:hypothetical protein